MTPPVVASEAFFAALLRRPGWALLPLVAILLLAMLGLSDLRKDTRSDAFLAPDNPALVYRDLIRERFGLSDPLLIALVLSPPPGSGPGPGPGSGPGPGPAASTASGSGIYRPDILAFVQTLTERAGKLDNIDADGTISLATESLITGDEYGIEVAPILDPLPETPEEARAVREAVEDFPLFLGSLVARDGSATLIALQLEDESLSESSYRDVLALLDTLELPEGVTAHVAGEGAIAGYLGAYIDADAQRLNPLAGMIILGIIVLAFRRLVPAALAVVMIVAAVAVSLGSMAALGIPFYVITNALPVILIGIAVADTIHVCSHYFHLQAAAPQLSREELIVRTMSALWLPVTVTSLTTAAGFLGLYLAADMPPFRYFGLFAALGVATAWLYSLFALPVLMRLLRMQVHQSSINQVRRGGRDRLAAGMQRLGGWVRRAPLAVVIAYGALALLGAWGASQLVVDDDRIRLFGEDEPIVQADRAINTHFNGTNTLDIVIETGESEGLFEPSVLRRMEALQAYAESLPHVAGSSSIVDYLKQMNRVLNGGEPEAYVLPDSRELVAQYFLLYSFSADPADFENEVDYDYRSANVRLTLDHGGYLQIRRVVESLDDYLAKHFDESVSATQSGRVSLNYYWIRNIGDSHLAGLVIALLLVWAVGSLSFRSTLAGVYTLVPVVASILIVYAFMVWRGMTLGVGTSMFAAVAIGLGVDFAIHTISRLRTLHSDNISAAGESDMYTQFYTTTGRALLLNVLAVACGFGVLIASRVAQLADFGAIVMLSMGVSFLASVTLLPALIMLRVPGFITEDAAARKRHLPRVGGTVLVAVAAAFFWLSSSAQAQSQDQSVSQAQAQLQAQNESAKGASDAADVAADGAEAESEAASVDAGDTLTAAGIVARVNAVPQGERVTRELLFRTTDKRDRTRERETISYRRYFGDERRLALFFTAPANIRDTAVLTWDYADPDAEDDQWLYLPALRKVRRIPASDRGDYFLGTDFSFEDMKLDGKLSTEDYAFTLLEPEATGTYRLEGQPRSEAIAEELGYSRTETVVDAGNWVVIRVEFWDDDGEYLKTLHADEIRQVDGIWTRHRLLMENHQSGHSTELIFSNVDYRSPVDERVFTQQALRRGG